MRRATSLESGLKYLIVGSVGSATLVYGLALIYGANHPYGGTAIGEPETVARFAQADLVRFKDQYLRPDNLEIFIVSDQPLAELTPLLERHFGQWQAPAGVGKGAKAFTTRPASAGRKIILIGDAPPNDNELRPLVLQLASNLGATVPDSPPCRCRLEAISRPATSSAALPSHASP
jgi:hypothetical protein